MATDLPGNFGNLVANIVTNNKFDIQQTDMNGVEGVLDNWQLPQEVHNFLSNIMYSDSVMYQTYHFAVWSDTTMISEFVASGQNDGTTIMLSYIQVDVHGDAVSQWVSTEHCDTIFFFFEDCHTDWDQRGFSTEELISMQNGMLYYGYQALLG